MLSALYPVFLPKVNTEAIRVFFFYLLVFVVHASSLSACICQDCGELELGGAYIGKHKGCLLIAFCFSHTVQCRAAQLLYIFHSHNE